MTGSPQSLDWGESDRRKICTAAPLIRGETAARWRSCGALMVVVLWLPVSTPQPASPADSYGGAALCARVFACFLAGVRRHGLSRLTSGVARRDYVRRSDLRDYVRRSDPRVR